MNGNTRGTSAVVRLERVTQWGLRRPRRFSDSCFSSTLPKNDQKCFARDRKDLFLRAIEMTRNVSESNFALLEISVTIWNQLEPYSLLLPHFGFYFHLCPIPLFLICDLPFYLELRTYERCPTHRTAGERYVLTLPLPFSSSR